jgi:hypothetical protein
MLAIWLPSLRLPGSAQGTPSSDRPACGGIGGVFPSIVGCNQRRQIATRLQAATSSSIRRERSAEIGTVEAAAHGCGRALRGRKLAPCARVHAATMRRRRARAILRHPNSVLGAWRSLEHFRGDAAGGPGSLSLEIEILP